MDEATRSKILKISYEIRHRLEDFQMIHHDLYFADLCGLCAIGSGRLFKALKQEGINTTICFSEYHCFLLYKSKYVIDVTATQFDFTEKVLIKLHTEIMHGKCDAEYDVVDRFYDIKSAKKYQYKKDWDITQIME